MLNAESKIDCRNTLQITRRDFSRLSALAGIAFLGQIQDKSDGAKASVAIVKTTDRKLGFQKAVELLGEISYEGKDVYLKCSYNSPNPYPATTHPKLSAQRLSLLRQKEAGR